MKTEPKTVAAVDRALSVLGAFRDGESYLSLTTIADRTGLYMSTILRLALTLEKHGYIARGDDGKYRIGSEPLKLAARYQSAIQPHEFILPTLSKLVRASGESASFNVREGKRRICLYRIDSPHRIHDHTLPGDTLELPAGAAGKVLAAFSDDGDRSYAEIRKSFIGRSAGEVERDAAGVAAPVFGVTGLAGALALSGPRTRFDAVAIANMEIELITAAAELTAKLGGDSTIFPGRRPTKKKS